MNADVTAVLALSRGRHLVANPASWENTLAIARKERCAALAWHRSGAEIRRLAPPDVVRQWRSDAMAAVDLAAFWESVLARSVPVLRRAGVEPVILKGMPLGQKLYGTTGARPSADLDVFVDRERRPVAHRALVDAGWRWRGGEAPYEAGYETAHEGRQVLLEVHSALLDDPLVRHLSFAAPRGRPVVTGATEVLAHDDDQLPAFLAVHLAKHAMPPLLWFIDFGELWERLDAGERERASAAARAARASRYLEWAVRKSALLAAAAEGGDAALAAFGIRDGDRSEAHTALRVAALASTPRDALTAVAGWAAPSELRARPAQLLARLVQRFGKFARRRLGRPYSRSMARVPSPVRAADPATRALTLGSADFAELARDLAARDCAFWIRAMGSSMEPAIPGGAAVRLVPIRGQPVAVGDIVLADLGKGRIVLHRVRRIVAGEVLLRGDANVRTDRAVPLEKVLARADAVRLDGRVMPVPAARTMTVRMSLRRWAVRLGAGEGLVRAATHVRRMRRAAHAD